MDTALINTNNITFDVLKEEILRKFEELHQMLDARKQVVMSKLLAIKEEAERTTKLDEGIAKLKHAKELMIATLTENIIGEERKLLEGNFDNRIKEAEARKLLEKSSLVKLRCYMDKIQEGISQIDLIQELPVYANKAAARFICGKGEHNRPRGISIANTKGIFNWEDSRLYIVDAGNMRIQVRNSRDGRYIKEFGTGYLKDPYDITICNQYAFVTDKVQHNVTKFKQGVLQWFSSEIDIDGKYVNKVGSQGTGSLQFNTPHGITSGDSTLYICDFHNGRIQVLDTGLKYVSTIRVLFGPVSIQVTSAVILVMGQSTNTVHMYCKSTSNLLRSIQLTGQEYKMQSHHFFTVDAAGNYLVSAHYENSIRIFDSEGVLRHTLGHIKHPMGILAPKGIFIPKDILVPEDILVPKDILEHKGTLVSSRTLVLSNNTIICVSTGGAFHIY